MSLGYSIPQKVLNRITPLEKTKSGRAKTYIDPITGEVFTQYAVQRARNFGLTPAQAASAKKIKIGKRTGFDIAREATKRHEHMPVLFDRASGMQSKSKSELMKDKKFWQRVRDLSKGKRKQSKADALFYFSYTATPTLYGEDAGDVFSDIDDDFFAGGY